MVLDDLARTAEELRKLRLDVVYEIVYGPQGGLEGLDVSGEFFPLWELRLAENQGALDQLDFAAIKARRSADWSVRPPR